MNVPTSSPYTARSLLIRFLHQARFLCKQLENTHQHRQQLMINDPDEMVMICTFASDSSLNATWEIYRFFKQQLRILVNYSEESIEQIE